MFKSPILLTGGPRALLKAYKFRVQVSGLNFAVAVNP